MALHVKMKNPATGAVQVLSPQNALDMEQHCGWKRLGLVKVREAYTSNPQDVLDGKIQRRRNAAQASIGPADDADEAEEVDSLDEVDTDADAEGEADVDADADADAEDDYETKSAISAGR